jgi:phosphate transport system substrate-binding protein
MKSEQAAARTLARAVRTLSRHLHTAAAILVTGTLVEAIPSDALADALKVGGSGAGVATIEVLADAFQKTPRSSPVTQVRGLGSHGGKQGLLQGAIDLAVVAAGLSPAEEAQGLTAEEIGRTPFVFVTSPRNAVSDLSLAQLVDIYAGRMITWPDGSRLRLILRPRGDSDTHLLRSISPAMQEAVDSALARPGLTVAATDQDSADAVERTPGAIGTSTLGQLLAERRPLKALAIGGIRPSAATVGNGTYPYSKRIYLVTGRTRTPATEAFLTFTRSKDARQVLLRLEYWSP